MIRRLLAALILSLIPALAFAQGNFVLQSGGITPGHAAQFVTNGVIGDGGAALGGPAGTNLTEVGITNTGTPWCITDVPNTSPYHQLCFGANTLLGYGVLSFNPYGGAQPIPFDCIINGVFIPNCLSGGGTTPGPCSATAAGLVPATGGGTANFLRADCTFATPPGGGNTITITANPCITATPNPITGVGTISTIVPFTVPCGGTGDDTLTPHSVLLGAGTSPVVFATVGTAGKFLMDNGGSADPSFSVCVNSQNFACLNLPQTWTAGQRAQWSTLTISTATFTPNFDTAQNFSITLVHASCPCTLANSSTTLVPGQAGMFEIIQSATGSDTIGTYGTTYLASTEPSLSTTANAKDYVSYIVNPAGKVVFGAPVLNAH